MVALWHATSFAITRNVLIEHAEAPGSLAWSIRGILKT